MSKFVRAGAAAYVGLCASPAALAAASAAAKGSKIPKAVCLQADVFRQSLAELDAVLGGSADVVCAFHEMHLLMESRATAECFFANVHFLLKVGGICVATVHDGAHLWYALQKEMPENPPADFRPGFKRPLFACATEKQISQTVGEKYRLKIRGKGGEKVNGFLINNSELRKIAEAKKLELVTLQNCGELYDNYRPIFGENLKKKIGASSLAPEQREYVEVFQLAVFRKRE
jgi:hypothetical protein